MLEDGHSTIECKADVANEYGKRLDAALSGLVWSHPTVHSFYRSSTGRVVVNMPWKIADYWSWTRRIEPNDYTLG